MKYGAWTLGQTEAILNVLGGEGVASALIAGAKVAKIEDAVRMLFDKHGRRIPPQGMKAPVVDANRDFHLDQPQVDFAERLFWLHWALGLTEWFLQPEKFERRTAGIIQRMRQDKLLINLFRGVFLPIVLPRMEIVDYGTALEETLLPAVGRAHQAEFPDRFYCTRRGALDHEVENVYRSRHEELKKALAAGPVVALYFPTALQGYSIPADLEQMATLPDEVLLAGALEPATALAMYPDILARDGHTPGLDCAAVSWRGRSVYFRASDNTLDFDSRSPGACGHCSGGLVVLG